MCKKIFSSIEYSIPEKGGRKVASFWPIVTLISHRRQHLRTLGLWQLLLYSSRSICPESFKIFWWAVLQKPRKGGGTHNVMLCGIWTELDDGVVKWTSYIEDSGNTTPPVSHCEHNKINAAAVNKYFSSFKIRYMY
jgi:hypothetical protein